jgi:hypothetical protein
VRGCFAVLLGPLGRVAFIENLGDVLVHLRGHGTQSRECGQAVYWVWCGPR